MNFLKQIGKRCPLVVAVFMAIGFTGVASAVQVAEFGESGFLNIDYQVQARAGLRDTGSGPDGTDDTTDIYLRRNRLSFLGALNESIGFALQFEYNGGERITDTTVAKEARDFEATFLDGYIAYDPAEAFRIRAGKTKHILTREVQEGCFDPLSIDRSAFIRGPFKNGQTRDNGIVFWGNLYDNVFQYRLAVMRGNDFGDNKPDDMGRRYTGRVHLTFFDKETGLGYKGTYLGKKKVLTVGAGYETQANAVFSSGATGSEDYNGISYDLFYEQPTDMGTFTLSGAYYETDFNNAGVRGVADAEGLTGEKNGSYWKAGYMVGKVQVFGRYEDWSFAQLQGITGQSIKWTAVGLNYYIKGQDLRTTVEYSKNDFEKEDLSNQDFTTVLLQLQARF